MSFVVIQHHDTRHDDGVADVVPRLAGNLAMPVAEIENGAALCANHVYVSPPDALVSVRDSAFFIRPQAPGAGAPSPFDYFLVALAKEYGPRAIAICLAGAGDERQSGLRSVHEQGGLVIAQDPCQAVRDSPDRQANIASVVDLVLPIERIPDVLLWLSAGNGRHEPGAASEGAQALAGIVRHLSGPLGRNIESYKDSTLLRRVFRRMTRVGARDLTDYLSTLQDEADETSELTKDMLVHVTSFFRDPKSYEFLARTVIPKLVRQHPRSEPIRIWIAGCSTGEEVYSVAILFLEEIARAKRDLRLQILATDISERAIALGRAGLYPESIRRHVAPPRLRRFFIKEPGGYRVRPQLRESVLFAVHDLLADAPFSRLDMIVCRNVLIYMRREAQDKILSLFQFALKERGVFFIGIADTIGMQSKGFNPISYADRIFERVGGEPRRPPPLPFLRTREGPQMTPPKAEHEIAAPALQEAMLRHLHQMYGAASIMVNRQREILHYSGPVDRYLNTPRPEIGVELGSVLPDGIAANVQAAFRRAAQQRMASTLQGAKVERDGRDASVVVSAQPVAIGEDELVLLTFSEEQDDSRADQSETAEERRSWQSDQLEEELLSTRKRLEKTIRDLEVVNEELTVSHQEAMSVNEELQSMNEELEASQEEMQSLNEELMILNQQLQDAAEQQRSSASDLRNILNSSDVATLFLDQAFNIRFFTPPATALFGLIASDVGRPLADLARRFTDDRLLDDARAVLDNSLPSRREIFTSDDRWYLRKISPYRSDGGQAEGVVITFGDITEMKLVERDIRAAHAFTESVVETVRSPLLALDEGQRVTLVNKAFRDLFCADAWQFVGLTLADTPAQALAPLMRDIVHSAGHVENHRVEIEVPPRGRLALLATTREIGGEAAASMVLLVLEDITEKERIEQRLVIANQRLEHANLLKSQFLAAASHDLRQPLQTMRLLSAILQRKLADRDALKLNEKFAATIDVMNGVVNAILDINQLEAGAIRPSVQSFPANMLLNKLFDEFDFLVKAKGLSWRVLNSDRTLKSDPRLLIQILRNLLNNAIKFTASGKLLVGCRRRGDAVGIEIWDSGPGIPEADIAGLFDFFHKGQANPTGADDGLGLGLAIVRHLAVILGHDIKVASRVGKGSCFSTVVPLGDAAAAQVSARPLPRHPIAKARGIRVLIVEDDPSVRESLEMLLAEEGHSVAAAASGRDGVTLVSTGAFAPEVIIADYGIPGGMNGLEVIEAIRGTLESPIPAIVLTGDISAATTARFNAKADIHLTKPIQADELLEAIQSLRARDLAEAPDARAAGAAAPPAPRREERRPAATVFVVDDDEAVRDSMRQLLESCGHSAHAFASGKELLRTAALRKDGCLILDARMPEMDGFEVLRRLAAGAAHPPVIMITGQGDVQTAVRAMKGGAFDFIEKPVESGRLLACVDRALAASANSNEDASRRRAAAGVVARLTKRQRAVLDLIVAGHANKVIANELGIGQRTVESHRATVMKKLGVKTFADLIRVAIAAD
jgi:two-component system CheB/CheR fusion protein